MHILTPRWVQTLHLVGNATTTHKLVTLVVEREQQNVQHVVVEGITIQRKHRMKIVYQQDMYVTLVAILQLQAVAERDVTIREIV